MKRKHLKKQTIGWQEWVKLPDLGLPAIKAKIDTGAKTSSLHAFDIEPCVKNHQDYVCFKIHPLQGNSKLVVTCCEPVVDVRSVMSSNGHREQRFVISTLLVLGTQKWDIELTLSNRDPLRFRMLLGRQALSGNVLIDASKRLLTKKYKSSQVALLYS